MIRLLAVSLVVGAFGALQAKAVEAQCEGCAMDETTAYCLLGCAVDDMNNCSTAGCAATSGDPPMCSSGTGGCGDGGGLEEDRPRFGMLVDGRSAPRVPVAGQWLTYTRIGIDTLDEQGHRSNTIVRYCDGTIVRRTFSSDEQALHLVRLRRLTI
jgi:hypothetical protein